MWSGAKEAATILRFPPKTQTASVLRPRAGAVLDIRLPCHRNRAARLECLEPAAAPHLQAGFPCAEERRRSLSVSSPGPHLRERAPWTRIELQARRRISPVSSRAA